MKGTQTGVGQFRPLPRHEVSSQRGLQLLHRGRHCQVPLKPQVQLCQGPDNLCHQLVHPLRLLEKNVLVWPQRFAPSLNCVEVQLDVLEELKDILAGGLRSGGVAKPAAALAPAQARGGELQHDQEALLGGVSAEPNGGIGVQPKGQRRVPFELGLDVLDHLGVVLGDIGTEEAVLLPWVRVGVEVGFIQQGVLHEILQQCVHH
mmetsp:Transcript_28040/g.50822  ORF Transcript_28040/g.50822 Transcript_28040/m.50822 type:complete len:204 (+) Transcript_28040:602-1213(+)